MTEKDLLKAGDDFMLTKQSAQRFDVPTGTRVKLVRTDSIKINKGKKEYKFFFEAPMSRTLEQMLPEEVEVWDEVAAYSQRPSSELTIRDFFAVHLSTSLPVKEAVTKADTLIKALLSTPLPHDNPDVRR